MGESPNDAHNSLEAAMAMTGLIATYLKGRRRPEKTRTGTKARTRAKARSPLPRPWILERNKRFSGLRGL